MEQQRTGFVGLRDRCAIQSSVVEDEPDPSVSCPGCPVARNPSLVDSVLRLQASFEGTATEQVRNVLSSLLSSGPRYCVAVDAVSCSIVHGRTMLDKLKNLFDKYLAKRPHLSHERIEGSIGSLDVDSESDTTCRLRKGSVILHPFSAVFYPGTMVAIMGPSGCGKTTLVNILAGRNNVPYSGRVFVNGKSLRTLKHLPAAYVSQDDIFDGNERVRECLVFSRDLRMDFSAVKDLKLRRHVKDAYVDFALHVLGLKGVEYQRVGNEQMRGISGGQRRRLTLGLGLMSDAQIMYCDEPTTGLSAADARIVIRALRNLCNEYRMTIIAIIHQPSMDILNDFDHLVLFAYNGRCLYNGKVDMARNYFDRFGFSCPIHQNPADLFSDLASQHKGVADKLAASYKAHEQRVINQKVLEEVERYKTYEPAERMIRCRVAPIRAQIDAIGRRALRLWLRDRGSIAAIAIDSVIVGSVIGSLLFLVQRNKSVYYQLSALYLLILSVLSSTLWAVPLLVQQKTMFATEVADGYYAPLPYLIVTTFVSSLFVLIGNLILMLLMWALFGFEFHLLFLAYLTCALGFLCCDGVSCMCALACRSFATANGAATFLFTLVSFINGFTTNPGTLPMCIRWLSYFSPFFLVFEALSIAIIEQHDFAGKRDVSANDVFLGSKEEVYAKFGLVGRGFGLTTNPVTWTWAVDIFILFMMVVLTRFVAFYVMATFFVRSRKSHDTRQCLSVRKGVLGVLLSAKRYSSTDVKEWQ